jgi:hypothetical protein
MELAERRREEEGCCVEIPVVNPDIVTGQLRVLRSRLRISSNMQ